MYVRAQYDVCMIQMIWSSLSCHHLATTMFSCGRSNCLKFNFIRTLTAGKRGAEYKGSTHVHTKTERRVWMQQAYDHVVHTSFVVYHPHLQDIHGSFRMSLPAQRASIGCLAPT